MKQLNLTTQKIKDLTRESLLIDIFFEYLANKKNLPVFIKYQDEIIKNLNFISHHIKIFLSG